MSCWFGNDYARVNFTKCHLHAAGMEKNSREFAAMYIHNNEKELLGRSVRQNKMTCAWYWCWTFLFRILFIASIHDKESRFLFSFCIAVPQCCFKWAYYLQEMGYKNNDFLWQSFVKNKIKSDQNWYPIRFSPFASKPLWQPIICEYELGCY